MGELTPEEVARYPQPGTNVPVSIAFSPDGRWIAYLYSPEHSLRRDLFVLDVDSGQLHTPLAAGPGGVEEANLSLEEQLRRERRRELGQGVTSFAWAAFHPRLLVPWADGLVVLDAPDFVPRRVVAAGDHPLIDAQLSPDGSMVAYVADDELYVAPTVEDAEPRQVTAGARGTGRQHGLAEFIAQEEMDRDHGFWWSPDSRRLAFTEVDETHIPVYRIVHQGSDEVGEGAQEDHRYPFAGAENAKVRLAVIDAAGGDPVWMALGDQWEYLARLDWLAPDLLVAQTENREQTRLDLVALDPATGAARLLLTEESPIWINLHDLLRPLEGRSFLWASERSGFRHLEVRSSVDGSLQRVLTAGEWLVQSVDAVSADRVWFTATEQSPLERHLYEVPVAGGPVRRVTVDPGTHTAVIDHKTARFVDTWSSSFSPPEAIIGRLDDGTPWRPLLPPDSPPDPRLAELAGALRPPERLTVPTPAGETLHVMVYRPDDGRPGPSGPVSGQHGPYPTVVSVYGGPHAQRVTDNWSATVAMHNQYLRSLGFLVVVADNRGSAGRGLAFEAPLRWRAGTVEVDDQVTVVRWLVEQGWTDPDRVGIAGWSYGGYMSALCLAKAGDVFQVAVAGAPVTAWDGYDTHYTERYMGTPQANPDGYRQAAVMTHVGGIGHGALMLVHGLIDENVHFRHTARLANALIRARVPYELLMFPNERHMPRAEEDRVYMEERIRDFLIDKLKP